MSLPKARVLSKDQPPGDQMLRSLYRLATAIAMNALFVSAVAAEPCTRDTLRRVVDEAGARLRVVTAETQPRIMSALRRLKEKRGWNDPEGDEKAAAFMADERTAEFDTKAATLLALIDELSETTMPNDTQCSRLAELEAASLELQATVKAKARHIIDKLEREVGAESAPAQQAGAPTAPKEERAAHLETPSAAPRAPTPSTPAPKATEAPPSPPGSAPQAPLRRADEMPAPKPPAAAPAPTRRADATPPPKAAPPKTVESTKLPAIAPAPASKPVQQPHTGWSTETSERAPTPVPAAPTAPPQQAARNQPPPPMPPVQASPSESFTHDEIRAASRGFFGTISGGLANVIEHAFSTLGRPTGYVLGNEGGGAFIAGLRYGKGTLFLRDGSKREVYWHGPSIGYDFGASGSKTMFLVYNLKQELDVFSGFTGVEGSAYLVGGVGMTVLTDGKVIMAPIRSGLGVRFGANVGYIRFTARPTWNPF